jgi:hypothetical protein
MRLGLHVLALAAVFAAAAPRAEAGLGVGDAAPDFEGVEFINTEPCSFKGLRGHVVLVEIFRTW